ncbi:hypothetical protein Mapa_005572 [Marchantia paleacea]|nr:hypothetical protein Mapa_005572 [Marchantia paleacea]
MNRAQVSSESIVRKTEKPTTTTTTTNRIACMQARERWRGREGEGERSQASMNGRMNERMKREALL